MEDFPKSATTVKDPVCGMNLEPSTAKHKLEHAGKPYYFCCDGCVEKFRARPNDYLSRPAAAAGLEIINIAPAEAKKTGIPQFCRSLVVKRDWLHVSETMASANPLPSQFVRVSDRRVGVR